MTSSPSSVKDYESPKFTVVDVTTSLIITDSGSTNEGTSENQWHIY